MSPVSRDASAKTSPDFLAAGGEMGSLIRAFDWSSTPVGAPESWPQSLRVTVRLMLNSQHPMFIWWGEDLIQFYNDAYRQTMGPQMHPSALGARGRESWADIWPIIGPQIEQVMSGRGATWNVDQMVPINRHGTPEEVWWTYGYSPIDHDEGIGGVLVVCSDVTAQHLATAELKNRNERMAQLFEEAPSLIAVFHGPDHVIELANAAYREFVGKSDLVGKPLNVAFPELAEQGLIDLVDNVYKTGESFSAKRLGLTLTQDDGSSRQYHVNVMIQPIRDGAGIVEGLFIDAQDVTDHVLLEQRLNIINDELRHRAKNTLAMISAVASQTLRGAADPGALDIFHARLAAFGAAHDALAGRTDAGSEVGEVIRKALAGHADTLERYDLCGPMIEIGSKQSITLALAIHELATNATKYGALSAEEGRVSVSWKTTENTFWLEWNESGGPEVCEPKKTGFGSRLIRTVLAADFNADVTMDFRREGLLFKVTAPIETLG
ncbi:MAG: PAS domain-containing protein [Rhizobiaceae bacterium]|nr:PAS domain-containing protein [Rhizobiaceae bacterium]